MSGNYQVGPDTVVHFSYELRDEEGELVEQSDPELPLAFLYGYGQLSPALEEAFDGLTAGERRSVSIGPDEAFGPRREDGIIEVDRVELPAEISVGDEFEADHESGESVSLMVLEVLDDVVILDANHPLAGQTVQVSVQVDAVRPATRLEIAQAEEELEARESSAQTLLPGARLVRRPPTSDNEDS